MKKFWTFIFAIFVSFIPGIIGVFFTPHGASNVWYNALAKSVLTPAGWVFSVAWTILYILLGIALYLVIADNNKRINKSNAYWLFFWQMVLNACWSFVFFGAHSPEYAMFVLLALIIIAIFMARVFFKVSPAAFWLTIPYIIWLMFAFYLNGVIIYLN